MIIIRRIIKVMVISKLLVTILRLERSPRCPHLPEYAAAVTAHVLFSTVLQLHPRSSGPADDRQNITESDSLIICLADIRPSILPRKAVREPKTLVRLEFLLSGITLQSEEQWLAARVPPDILRMERCECSMFSSGLLLLLLL